MTAARSTTLRLWLLIPDCHHPFHDEHAWGLVLKVAKQAGPFYGVAILGDFFDFYAVSAHSKNPARRLDLEWEITEGDRQLGKLEAATGFKEKIFIKGNHEHRLERYIEDKAQEVFRALAPAGLLQIRSLEEALGLKQRGWQVVQYKDHTKIGKLFLTHDAGRAGQYAHYDAQAAFEGNVVIGHTHRFGYTIRGSAQGKPHVGAMLGWLGDADQADYMHRIRAKRDWALGFGIAYHDTETGYVFVTPLPIVGYSTMVEGRLYKV